MAATTSNRDEVDDLIRKRTVRVLETGFRVAVILLAVGLLLSAIRRDALPHDFGSPGDVLSALFDGTPAGFLGLGIAAIILTPLAATITIMASYLQHGDRRYAAITGAVVVILIASLSLSAL